MARVLELERFLECKLRDPVTVYRHHRSETKSASNTEFRSRAVSTNPRPNFINLINRETVFVYFSFAEYHALDPFLPSAYISPFSFFSFIYANISFRKPFDSKPFFPLLARAFNPTRVRVIKKKKRRKKRKKGKGEKSRRGVFELRGETLCKVTRA